MKYLLAIVLAANSAPGAFGQGVASRLIGSWQCAADFDGEIRKSSVQYLEGGRMIVTRTSPADNPASAGLELTTVGEGIWSVQADGVLVERETGLLDFYLSVDGKKIEPVYTKMAKQKPLEDGVISSDSLIVRSTVVFGKDGFVATGHDGIITTCKR